MPNPILDGLRQLEAKRNSVMSTPLLPQNAIQGAQDALTQPRLDTSVGMARLKGFGAGALQGLRDLTSPTNLLALGGLGMGIKGGSGPQGGGDPSMNPLGVREPYPIDRFGEPWLRTNDPEFVPPGGEASWNEVYQKGQAPAPEDVAYARIMHQRGASR